MMMILQRGANRQDVTTRPVGGGGTQTLSGGGDSSLYCNTILPSHEAYIEAYMEAKLTHATSVSGPFGSFAWSKVAAVEVYVRLSMINNSRIRIVLA